MFQPPEAGSSAVCGLSPIYPKWCSWNWKIIRWFNARSRCCILLCFWFKQCSANGVGGDQEIPRTCSVGLAFTIGHDMPYHAMTMNIYELTVQTIFGRHKANTSDASLDSHQYGSRRHADGRLASCDGLFLMRSSRHQTLSATAQIDGKQWKAPHFQTFPVQVSVSQAQRKMM